ncbi:DUF433 domain-containing protein [Candidatus Poribacteria bacterium]|nr:DUF433 domain-containing protein [Candidatus Poribacteria bacterium]
MRLEDYFDFLGPNVIRIKGHRINLEDIVDYYCEGYSPEQIAQEFPGLSLEKIYATIAYYLHNKTDVDAYMKRLAKSFEEETREEAQELSPVAQRIRMLKTRQARGTLRNF